MKDANLKVVQTLPNAGNTEASDAIDLEQVPDTVTGGKRGTAPKNAHLEVSIPAMANHTNTGASLTFTLQESAEAAANFANTDPVISKAVAGVGTTGSAAAVVDFPLAPKSKRYVKINVAATANSDSDELNATYTLVTLG